jgi:hypothetical protein
MGFSASVSCHILVKRLIDDFKATVLQLRLSLRTNLGDFAASQSEIVSSIIELGQESSDFAAKGS